MKPGASLVLRELIDQKNGIPQFGKPIGVYHSLASSDPFHVVSPKLNWLWSAVESKDFSELTPHQLTMLERLGLGISETTELPAPKPEPDMISIYVELTQACNFSCTGCAVGVDVATGYYNTLSQEDLDQMVTQATESAVRHGFKIVKLKWAGGEPLLPLPWMRVMAVQPLLKKLAKKYGVKYEQVVLTNGALLTPERANELKTYQMSAGISLWGLDDTNDEYRHPFATVTQKLNSYELVLEAINNVQAVGIPYNLIWVIMPQNADQLPELFRRFWSGNKPVPIHFSLYRPQNKSAMKEMMKSGYREMTKGILAGFLELKKMIIEGHTIQPLTKFDYMDFEYLKPTACGTGHNYMAFGPKGLIFCHEPLWFMKDNRETVKQSDFIDQGVGYHKGHLDSLLGYNMKQVKAWDPLWMTLAFHGGTGCPRTSRVQHGEFGNVGAAVFVYRQIVEALLSTELFRRFHKHAKGVGSVRKMCAFNMYENII